MSSHASSDDNSPDSRKRKSDDELFCDNEMKKPNIQIPDCGSISVKVLIPSAAAGAVIGKGGKSIEEEQRKTLTKIKMSKKEEFYPGSMERVCLISGCQEAVAAMLRYVMEKMLEKPEQSISPDGRGSFERQKQVKILVPNSTAGMIIGKKGSKIKELSDLSGSFIQISQKPKPDEPVLSERCVIVRGNLMENIVAMNMILDIIAQDPQSGSCTQTVYKPSQPVPSLFPTGSAYSDPLNLGLPSPLSQNDMTAALLAMTLPGIDNSLPHSFTASS
ncbi:hypothetical protein Ciccas_004358, partial [Cichlidogyrus casuarinus]